MPRLLMGAIINTALASPNQMVALIDPDDDKELDNPAWLQITSPTSGFGPLRMIKIPRSAYNTLTVWAQLPPLVASYTT